MVEQPRALSGISQEDWQKTPVAGLEVLVHQQQQIAELEKRIEKLQAQLNQNSLNSNKPPSSDNPYNKPPKETLCAQRTEQEKGQAGDLKVYETCPRQYQFFRHYEFTPARSAEIFFGALVHQTIEDIHRRVLDGKGDHMDEAQV